MLKVIVGAVLGLVFASFVLVFLGAVGFFHGSKFVDLWRFHTFTVFAIVGAVVGGTMAILERLDRP